MTIRSTTPAAILADYTHLVAQITAQPLDPAIPFLFCGSVCRHFAFPGANTPPWQLDGAALALRTLGAQALYWVAPQPPCRSRHIQSMLRIMRGIGGDPNGYGPVLAARGIESGVPRRPWVPVLLVTLRVHPGGGLIGARWWRDVWAQRLACDPALFGLTLADATSVAASPGIRAPDVCHRLLAADRPELVDALAAEQLGLPAQSAPVAAPGGPEWYRWSADEREIFESWLRDTAWGRLFREYQGRCVRSRAR
jgi:hypothetical protein